MKNFLKRNWALIILLIILLIVSVLSFTPGKYLLSNDNYSPELNPLLTIWRSLISPAWRGYRVLGFASDSEQADIFRTGILGLLDLVFNKNVAGQIYYLICMFIGSLSIGFFFRGILLKSKLKKYTNIGLLLSGLIYISTLWTVWTFYQTMAPYVTNFGFLPLLLLTIYRYVRESTAKNALWLFGASILFSAVSVIATLFIVDLAIIVVIITMFSIYYGKTRKVILKKIFKTGIIFLTTQLFWLLPFIFYTFSTSQDIISSYVNRSITSSVIDLETGMQTAVNTARLYSRILTDSNGTSLLFPAANDYLNYDFFKVIGLFPMILSLIGLIFSFIKKNWKFLIFFIIVLVCWFLIKVTNPPLGSVFTFLQEHVPLFKQVLRWPSSKLSEVYLTALTICSTWGLIYLAEFFSSFFSRKTAKTITLVLTFVVVIVPMIVYMNYTFLGNLFPKSALVSIPQEYYDLSTYLEENDPNGRIYYAPPANQNYFREYTWGFRGSQFISYIVPNPVMDLSSAVGSAYGEMAMGQIFDAFKAGNVTDFNTLLEQYDVKYLLVDKSLVTNGFTYNIDWNLAETFWQDDQEVWSEGELTLYKVSTKASTNLVEGLLTTSAGQFIRNSAQNPQVVPFSVRLQNWDVQDNELRANFIYTGNTTILTSNMNDLDWSIFPFHVLLKSGNLVISPSYPAIESSNYFRDPTKIFSSGEYDYFNFNGYILSSTQAEKGISIDESYGEITKIEGLKTTEFKNYDLTSILLKSTGENCGNTMDTSYKVNVSNLGIASGLELKGNTDLSCVYSNLTLEKSKTYVARVNINWEQDNENSIPGFCLYSQTQQKCLNNEKYMKSASLYGEERFLIPYTISGDDTITLILYALNLDTSSEANVTFRKVSVDLNSTFTDLKKVSEYNTIVEREVSLINGKTYTINVPILYGKDSYVYVAQDKNNLLWQPSIDASSSAINWNNGMESSVTNGYINLSNNLLSTIPQADYTLFWKGINTSNIPSTICLSYSSSNECWFQDLLLSSQVSSTLTQFTSNTALTNLLNGVIINTSYSNKTANTLEDFVIMKTPALWNSFVYSPLSTETYSQLEALSVFNVPYATYYKLSSSEQTYENTILTISQSQSKGWLAISVKGSVPHLLNTGVTVDGWKQGWDISNLSFDNIYILYWPNLLGYLGYVLIVIEFIYLLVKIAKKPYVRE